MIKIDSSNIDEYKYNINHNVVLLMNGNSYNLYRITIKDLKEIIKILEFDKQRDNINNYGEKCYNLLTHILTLRNRKNKLIKLNDYINTI